MTDEQQLTLAPNGHGAQAYLSRDLLGDTACPLGQGQPCRAEVYPGVGILIVPANDSREFTIQTMTEQQPEARTDD